ncbi:branched-chain amino acid ABC transporter permease [Janthinobacterium fluminis]|uniref:Branched-chain amino acid ABC transporter permease n=1 Tax=Janthinobacterium fluminis TaxID=2987524 RepID=A0ABT5JYB6_9BURK|nr:branched-chain amino acid ABC transporter permease [Janthinobacterium fluminis]MDC8757180.1 branched-chain amino acid ABC transporter permease [Janthinobacterium fluminis]
MTARWLSAALSGDTPRSRLLAGLLLAVFVGLLLAPLLFPGTRALNVAARICVFIVLAASYDLLLGYTGVVSFAHTMFFGIGAYGVGIAMFQYEADGLALLAGAAASLLLALLLALLLGVLSLRVRTIFFAMMSLALASFFATLASQFSAFTGGEDGLSFKLPALLSPATEFFGGPLLGVVWNGKLLTYYLVFFCSLALFLLALRVVNSPFGKVLQAIRENDFRAAAIGFNPVLYRTVANCLAALLACAAGILYALWLRYVGPDTTLSFSIMIDILLMVVIGGMGSMYGAALGAAVFVIAQNYLQDGMKLLSGALEGAPLLASLFHPDRWLLWLGVLFILSVYFFPSGIVGRLRGKP